MPIRAALVAAWRARVRAERERRAESVCRALHGLARNIAPQRLLLLPGPDPLGFLDPESAGWVLDDLKPHAVGLALDSGWVWAAEARRRHSARGLARSVTLPGLGSCSFPITIPSVAERSCRALAAAISPHCVMPSARGRRGRFARIRARRWTTSSPRSRWSPGTSGPSEMSSDGEREGLRDGVALAARRTWSASARCSRSTRRVLIYCHMNPDPDSLGAALAMRQILQEEFGKEVAITYRGLIGRAENRRLVELLAPDLQPARKIDQSRFDVAFLVDAQPGYGYLAGRRPPAARRLRRSPSVRAVDEEARVPRREDGLRLDLHDPDRVPPGLRPRAGAEGRDGALRRDQVRHAGPDAPHERERREGVRVAAPQGRPRAAREDPEPAAQARLLRGAAQGDRPRARLQAAAS